MRLKLHIWRQLDKNAPGKMVDYDLDGVSEHMSFLEMLDVLNEKLLGDEIEPVAFDHDCREGICGMCSLTINGEAHGPERGTTVCQLHMRRFKDGDDVYIEPFRAKAFPVLRDLIVDRTAFDDIIRAGGFITNSTGSATDANSIPIGKAQADTAMDAAACIGCGACVAACPNASASLFVAAKLAHLSYLPQGEAERYKRARSMVDAMDAAGFGSCTNHYECEAVCPKGISSEFIARMNRDYAKASLLERDS